MSRALTPVWTGPKHSNPRNRTTRNWKTGKYGDLLATPALSGDHLIGFSRIEMRSGEWFLPLSGIVDTVVTRGKNHDGDQVQTGLSFVGWDNDASANGWRVAYHVECDLLGGTFAVHRIDVAPDVDDGSEPPALFNDGTGPESLPA